MTEEAAQVGAGPERENQRKEEGKESSKPGRVVPTGPAHLSYGSTYVQYELPSIRVILSMHNLIFCCTRKTYLIYAIF